MSGRSVVTELRRILQSLPQMNEEEKELAVERLSSFGVETPQGDPRRPGVECPFLEMRVVSPCGLGKCKYHIENEWSRNCLLEYVDVQGSDTLASEEIAFLYGISTERVDSVIDKGMEKLRASSEETVGFSGDFKKKRVATVTANVDADENFTITSMTVSPPFMKKVNKVLEVAAPEAVVLQHPAIRILGVIDTIINELE